VPTRQDPAAWRWGPARRAAAAHARPRSAPRRASHTRPAAPRQPRPQAVPVLDLSAGDDAALAAALGAACRGSGFFAVAGHGVPPAVVDAMFDQLRALFGLPLDEKMAMLQVRGEGRALRRGGGLAGPLQRAGRSPLGCQPSCRASCSRHPSPTPPPHRMRTTADIPQCLRRRSTPRARPRWGPRGARVRGGAPLTHRRPPPRPTRAPSPPAPAALRPLHPPNPHPCPTETPP
jgi:isopenicillin N synthase-like dioxygenase